MDTVRGRSPLAVVLENVARERQRQDEKWGEQNHDNEVWNTILVEEVGEVSQALLALRFDVKLPTSVREEHLRSELEQVAAVAVAWLECIDRKRWERSRTCSECGRLLNGYRGPRCRYCDGTAE